MDMAPYKAQFIELLVESGVLLFGDFKTKSGRQSPYFINTGYFKTGAQAHKLSEFYAAALQTHLAGQFDVLFGPAYKGIPLCTLAAASLWRLYGVEVGYCFNRKEAKDHGEGGLLVGWQLRDGDRVAIIEDVVTAGTAVRETVPLLRAAANVQVRDMIICVDRMEKGYEGTTATQEIQRDWGITVHAIVTVREILSYLHNREVGGRVILDDAVRERMERYMAQYCL